MKNATQFENLGATDRVLRFVISMVAILAAMESSLAGTPALATISVLAIALTTTAVIGWDPLKALTRSIVHSLSHHQDTSFPGHSA